MLEFAFLMLLAPSALTQGELAEELRVCRAIQDRMSRLQCYDQVVSGLEAPAEKAAAAQAEKAAAAPAEKAAAAPAEKAAAAPAEKAAAAPAEKAAAAPAVKMAAAPAAAEGQDDEPAVKASAERPVLPTGKWILETDPSGGKAGVSAALLARENSSRPRSSVRLVVRCQGGQTSVTIDWDEYLEGDSPVVRTRIDALAPLNDKWSRSPDKRGSVYKPLGSKRTRQERIVSLARQLTAAEKLVARVIPTGERPVTAVFDLAGVEGALRPVREACGW